MADELKPKSGLYVTATPIGNLADLSPRAEGVLKSVDAIICEDTRVSQKLLSRFGIKKPLIALHDHNEARAIPVILAKLEAGEALAIISDAGTPLISDPGYQLVKAAQDKGITVTPIPGPSAPITALQAAGLAPDKFLFAGFLPPKAGARDKALEDLKDIPATLIFFESPKRVTKTLAAMARVFGEGREAVLARELTKMHEEILRDSLGGLLTTLEARDQIKGEIVLLVARGEGDAGPADVDEVLLALLKTHSVSDAATMLAKLTGQSRKVLYSRALELKS